MLTRRWVLRFVATVLALLAVPAGRLAGAPEPLRQPKLVIVLVIDQFRYDYLQRFRPYFVEGGFRLLLDGGANFVDCRYDYATTATGPGHATLLTGAYPNMHGIIGNEWYDPIRHKPVKCVEDPTVKPVTDEGMRDGFGMSPRNLLGSTLGDELRMASNFESKVIAISLKDRAAILPGGHTANAAYWYNSKTGHFVTSTYYMTSLPAWVRGFNSQPPALAYCGKGWEALPETPGAGGKTFSTFRGRAGEACPDPQFLDWINETPNMNEIELNFAREAIRNEHLGQGTATDLLTVSLSVNDYIGHAAGPYNPEVADATLRTDRYLRDFFLAVDQMVGLHNVWVALSADHGVAPTPRFIKEHHLGPGNVQLGSIKEEVDKALNRAFGSDNWVEDAGEFCIYLNQSALKKHDADPAKAETIAAEAAESLPWIWAAFPRARLESDVLSHSPMVRKAMNSFNRKRSGDVFLVLDPYAVPTSNDTSTTHGSPWNYDAQVPMVLWGSAFKPGTYAQPCQTIDLAATLAAALGLTQPSGAQGRALAEALR